MKNFKLALLSFMTIFTIASCDDEPMAIEPNADLQVIDMVFNSDDLDPDNNVFSGTVTITGVIINTGTTDFVSGANQQQITLTEDPQGGANLELATQQFTRVNAGDTVYISYARAWSLTNEFPPSFIVDITYDPDIFSDENLENDDIDLTNNSLTKTGYDIHNTF